MNKEAQRIAIAEFCGWKPTTDGGICWNEKGDAIISPPDYLNDLNACHEMEKTLNYDQGWIYNSELEKLVGTFSGIGIGKVEEWRWHATAKKKAEAFLKTIGKWEPEPPTP